MSEIYNTIVLLFCQSYNFIFLEYKYSTQMLEYLTYLNFITLNYLATHKRLFHLVQPVKNKKLKFNYL